MFVWRGLNEADLRTDGLRDFLVSPELSWVPYPLHGSECDMFSKLGFTVSPWAGGRSPYKSIVKRLHCCDDETIARVRVRGKIQR